MKKKIICISLFFLIILLSACGNAKNPNYLKSLKLNVKDVINGSGDKKIGEYAYINADKKTFEKLENKYFIEFLEDVVKDSGYNWVVIKFKDGTGITCPHIQILTYGKLNSRDMVSDIFGYYVLENGKMIYKEK